MSQFPPNPPMTPPSMTPPPPYGSPYGQPGYPMGPTRTSGMAVASFICGLLGCLVITPLVALILGFFAIGATKDPRVTGRGFAIAGIILALLWLAGFVLGGGGIYTFYVKSQPVAAIAQQFVTDEVNGNTASAMSHCDSTSITADELQTLADQIKKWGAYKDLKLWGRNVITVNGDTTWTLTGPATFGSTVKMFTFTLRLETDGSYKIVKYQYQ